MSAKRDVSFFEDPVAYKAWIAGPGQDRHIVNVVEVDLEDPLSRHQRRQLMVTHEPPDQV